MIERHKIVNNFEKKDVVSTIIILTLVKSKQLPFLDTKNWTKNQNTKVLI